MPPETAEQETETDRLISRFVDRDWYKARYPDVAAAGLDPATHFIRFGATEQRDPNRFFNGTWYIEHYPDVASSGLHPLLHYLQAGAAELRNPHPRFDALYYVEQHPEAASNPLLFHLQIGLVNGYLTEKPIDIKDYLPSTKPGLDVPARVFVDVVIVVVEGMAATELCLASVLADRSLPLARVTVVDDGCVEQTLSSWLRHLADEGEINLIRNRRRLGFAACVNQGIDAAESHDVVVLDSDTVVPAGWLGRLAAQAWAQPTVATVSPFSDNAALLDDGLYRLGTFGRSAERLDAVCRVVNAGRSVRLPAGMAFCLYIRRDALRAVGLLHDGDEPVLDFCMRATASGLQHRLACDVFVPHADLKGVFVTPSARFVEAHPAYGRLAAQCKALGGADPFRFAVTAALFRDDGRPVILMVSHDLGGGIRRHILSLAKRYRDSADIFLLEGTDRGAALSAPVESPHALLVLPSDRIEDLAMVLQSAGLSRIHIHHLLHMDMDIRRLIHRLGVRFDVTVHDYFAICPQINLLRWPEGIYCGEPDEAGCNACIADLSSHGAKDILSWRREKAWQFLEAERVICPSEDVKVRLDRYGLANHAVVAAHEPAVAGHWPIRRPKLAKEPLRIVLLGVLANHKGARIVAAVAEAAKAGTIDLHLVGHLEPSFPKQTEHLIKTSGWYREEEFEGLVRRVRPQVFWFPSSAPETYSYTLSFAIASGLPVVATKLGSFPERLAGRPNTWLVDHRANADDYLTVFDAVRATLENASSVSRVRRPPVGDDFYDVGYLVSCKKERTSVGVGKRRIVVVPERLKNGSATLGGYIRLLLPLDHPALGDDFEIILANADTVFDHEADIIATHRLAIADIETVDRLIAQVRRQGATLLFDLDDDLVNVPDSHPEGQFLRPHSKVVRRMLTNADVVWLSTPALAQRLSHVCPDAVVIENRLDERIWTCPAVNLPAWDDPVRILCMGTGTHDRDFALIEPVLRRLKADYGARIVIDVLGMTQAPELAAGLNRIGPSPHGTRSYPAFVNWINAVRPGWHIGLAPLLDTAFNRSKSALKVLDYAALGLAVLASDMPVYRGSIADGPGGQLVANAPEAWYAALDWLIRDQALRRRLSQGGREALRRSGTLGGLAVRRRASLLARSCERAPER